MNWTIAALVFGGVVGVATYLWLSLWTALRFGAFVAESTGSDGLGFGAYWISVFAALCAPFAIVIGLTA